MPIIGGRQASVRGLGFQGAGAPSAPTINSVTVSSTTSVTIAYTLGANNGAPITSINITSSPSTSLTYTNTDLDGSILVTASFDAATSYTFTMTAINAVGSSNSSNSSSSVTPNPPYALLSTITNSGNYVVPSGITSLAVFATGGGAGGGTGGTGYYNDGGRFLSIGGGGGGAGGTSAALASFQDEPTNSGTTYSVNIGAGGNANAAGGRADEVVS